MLRWNRHLACSWHGLIMDFNAEVEWASWWNRHLACYNLRAGRMPTLLLFIA
ncbi:hypothetical protein [Moorena producens]|uniref:hypothetical protein n=1 Tax=Moorena producens TaxID=1155739 RepID=UPI003C743435